MYCRTPMTTVTNETESETGGSGRLVSYSLFSICLSIDTTALSFEYYVQRARQCKLKMVN